MCIHIFVRLILLLAILCVTIAYSGLSKINFIQYLHALTEAAAGLENVVFVSFSIHSSIHPFVFEFLNHIP